MGDTDTGVPHLEHQRRLALAQRHEHTTLAGVLERIDSKLPKMRRNTTGSAQIERGLAYVRKLNALLAATGANCVTSSSNRRNTSTAWRWTL
ncbi:MAG: hypothetical protein R3E42_16345 [Burkholderiaceae bacterium]